MDNLPRRIIKLSEETGETSEAFLYASIPDNRKNITWNDFREEAIDSYSSRSVSAFFYSRAVHTSPINDVEYPPAEILVKCRFIIAFEIEEEATGFKLRWDQINVC